MKTSPLVCVFAHPDDEAFGPSGTIAKLAKERDVYIICATNGDADQRFSKDPTRDLGKIRPDELRQSARILGVKGVEFLNFGDGTLSNNLYHQLADAIQKKLDKYKPDTLMTFDMLGISGHIDHITVALAATFVFYKLDYVKDMLYFVEREELLAEDREDYFIYIPPGYTREQVDMIVDVSPFWDQKIRAMKAHESQKSDADWLIEIKSRLPKEEFFLKRIKP